MKTEKEKRIKQWENPWETSLKHTLYVSNSVFWRLELNVSPLTSNNSQVIFRGFPHFRSINFCFLYHLVTSFTFLFSPSLPFSHFFLINFHLYSFFSFLLFFSLLLFSFLFYSFYFFFLFNLFTSPPLPLVNHACASSSSTFPVNKSLPTCIFLTTKSLSVTFLFRHLLIEGSQGLCIGQTK